MSTMDTGSYVRHRLRVVGTTDGPTFSDDALDQVQVATGGLPRLVNRLCDRVLMSAYLDRTRDIDLMRVARAAAELREELGDSGRAPPALRHHQLCSQPPMPLTLDRPTASARKSMASRPGGRIAPAPAQHVGQATRRLRHRASEASRLPGHAAGGGPTGCNAAAASLLAVSLGWLAYDRSSPRNTTRLGATAPASVVAPAGRADACRGRPHPPDVELRLSPRVPPARRIPMASCPGLAATAGGDAGAASDARLSLYSRWTLRHAASRPGFLPTEPLTAAAPRSASACARLQRSDEGARTLSVTMRLPGQAAPRSDAARSAS